MMNLPELIKDYSQKQLALPSFNIDSFEIYQAVERAVRETGLPCLVQLSDGEDKFIEAERLFMLVRKANHDGLPIYLNMDHGQDISRLEKMADLGFDMLHFDGSKLNYADNISIAKLFISKIKSRHPQTLIEAEFNHINLVDAVPDPSSFTDPLQAKEFIGQTGADLLAVSIGNLHGVSTSSPERLNVSLLSQIHAALPETFLTLHGGSGVSSDQIRTAISLGVVKININTDLRLEFIKSLKNQLVVNQTEKIYQILDPAITDVTAVVKQRLIDFSSK